MSGKSYFTITQEDRKRLSAFEKKLCSEAFSKFDKVAVLHLIKTLPGSGGRWSDAIRAEQVAERWGIPCFIICEWIENEEIRPVVRPFFARDNPYCSNACKNVSGPCWQMVIEKNEIERLEKERPELKKAAETFCSGNEFNYFLARYDAGPMPFIDGARKPDELKRCIQALGEKNARIAALETQLAEKDERITELEARSAVIAEPTTTVNAAKWGSSVTAAFGVWAVIIAGDKADWKEDEFRAALAERCSDYHTDVHATAWRLLPDAFKHGIGRPKKKPEKPQQSDNP